MGAARCPSAHGQAAMDVFRKRVSRVGLKFADRGSGGGASCVHVGVDLVTLALTYRNLNSGNRALESLSIASRSSFSISNSSSLHKSANESTTETV